MIQKYGSKCSFMSVKVDQTEFAEQTGYLSTRELVERFMEAGRRLSNYRKGLLDFDEGDDYEDQQAVDIYDYDEPTHFQDRISDLQLKIKPKVAVAPSVSEEQPPPSELKNTESES